MEEEKAKFRRCLKKIIAAILTGVLLIGKLANFCAAVQLQNTRLVAWLSVSSLVFIAPMYYMSATVHGYNAFRVCACGALLTEAAQFFLYLGVSRDGSYIVFELFYILILCLLLTTIEELFEEKHRREAVPLSEVVEDSSSYSYGEESVEHDPSWRRLLCKPRQYS